MNLFLALFWLVCAALLFVYEQSVVNSRFRIRISTIDFSYVWPMLLLVLYNLKRWWSIHRRRATQRALEEYRIRGEWRQHFQANEPAVPRDPNFNFTDDAPPPSNRAITDHPQPPVKES